MWMLINCRTYTAKVLVEQLDVSVYDLEDDEFVVALLHGAAEVETGVALVDDLEVLPLEERAHLWLPGGNCIKIGLPGKSILRDYFQENITSRRPFLLLRIRGLIQ